MHVCCTGKGGGGGVECKHTFNFGLLQTDPMELQFILLLLKEIAPSIPFLLFKRTESGHVNNLCLKNLDRKVI